MKKKGFNVKIDLENELIDYGTETQFREVMKYDRKKKLKRIKAERKITLKSMQMKNAITKDSETETKTDKNN